MFLNPQPVWSFTANKQLRLWYGHVHLWNDYVVGQWFVLKRSTGECLWEREFHRANTIFEIVDGVILASEMRSDGPWTASFGCYCISLSSGEMLWKWYGKGLRGKCAELLDRVPKYTNGFRPRFAGVLGNECATEQGHVLDIHTGQLLREESEISISLKTYGPQTAAEKIYRGQPIEIAPNLFLSTRAARVKTEALPAGTVSIGFPKQTRPFGFILQSAQGQVVWDWGPADLGLHQITNYYGWRLMGSKMLVLCGDEPATMPIRKEKPLLVKPNATRYRLLVVDALAGKVDQQFIVSGQKVDSCRIEDVDGNGILLSSDNRNLRYYIFTN
jgi:hypothetical protein